MEHAPSRTEARRAAHVPDDTCDGVAPARYYESETVRPAQHKLVGSGLERARSSDLALSSCVPSAGFEPATSSCETVRSVQLSYEGDYGASSHVNDHLVTQPTSENRHPRFMRWV